MSESSSPASKLRLADMADADKGHCATSIFDLPEECLVTIFAAVNRAPCDVRNMALRCLEVCKCWGESVKASVQHLEISPQSHQMYRLLTREDAFAMTQFGNVVSLEFKYCRLSPECKWFLVFYAFGKRFKHLKSLQLSQVLEQVDDFSLTALCNACPKLEAIALHGAISDSVTSLPEDIKRFSCLIDLRISGCQNVEDLHVLGLLTRLQCLEIFNFPRLKELPVGIGSLQRLMSLKISDCPRITELPDSFTSLEALQFLVIGQCPKLCTLPRLFGRLKSLQDLRLVGCTALLGLPDSIGSLSSLREMRIRHCASLTVLPSSVESLSGLEHLSIKFCAKLLELPSTLGGFLLLKELSLGNCGKLTKLPDSIGQLTSMRSLKISKCCMLEMLPESIGSLWELERLRLEKCNMITTLPASIDGLTSLKELVLDKCSALSSLPLSMEKLTGLKRLSIRGCSMLMYDSNILCLTAGMDALEMIPDPQKDKGPTSMAGIF